MSEPVTPSPDNRPKISARARLQIDKLSGKPTLIAQETVLVLNETGAAIVNLCDGVRTVGAIAKELAAQYNAPLETITVGVEQYLTKLNAMNLVSWHE